MPVTTVSAYNVPLNVFEYRSAAAGANGDVTIVQFEHIIAVVLEGREALGILYWYQYQTLRKR